MQKERLFISQKKVRVEYEFLNDTDRDIATEVAFPIPPYGFAYDDPGGPRGIDDFRVWVESKELKYQTEMKAMVNGKDVNPFLQKFKVDANSFGNFDWDKDEPLDFLKLSSLQRGELVRSGAFDGDSGHFAKWTVWKTYHWTQVFPAHSVIQVVHEYRPMRGFAPIQVSQLDAKHRMQEIAKARTDRDSDQWIVDLDKQVSNACVDENTRAGIAAAVKVRQSKTQDGWDATDYVSFSWVDYILTTANSWKTPIKDFELVIEKPAPDGGGRSFVSFCWDGPVQKVDDRHFSVRAKDFVPKRELHVAFFSD